MPIGRKTGGRTKGTPNKATVSIIEKLAALGCDPIEGMARIAMDERNTPELRARMLAELANYVAAKRKAVEMSSDDDTRPQNIEIAVRLVKPVFTEEQLQYLQARPNDPIAAPSPADQEG